MIRMHIVCEGHTEEMFVNEILAPYMYDKGIVTSTAPSKRIASLYAGYAKPVHPILAAKNIGMNAIRQECPLFNDWLSSLEALAFK